jgi:hypothetical protein
VSAEPRVGMPDAYFHARYARDLAADDPVARQVAARQLARLGDRLVAAPRPVQTSPWAHVPLADLFAEQGNRLRVRSDGTIETGHEPLHTTNGGRCVLIDPGAGRWWCRSCRQSGDAATYVAAVLGGTYLVAAGHLAARYGSAAGRSRRPQRTILEATVP